MAGHRDNSTFAAKVRLRRQALAELAEPALVLEAFGGTGRIFERCYEHLDPGLVIERDSRKAELLARQRPSWAVYQGDSVAAVGAGLWKERLINFVDADPWGDPWALLGAFFEQPRSRAHRLAVVVTDGLEGVQRGVAWRTAGLKEAVRRHGSRMYTEYGMVCREQLEGLAASQGYELSGWVWRQAGPRVAHYAALLSRRAQAG